MSSMNATNKPQKLTNLREVLKASHKIKLLNQDEKLLLHNDECDESKRSSQLSLIDNILKLSDIKLDNRFLNDPQPIPPPHVMFNKYNQEIKSFRIDRKDFLLANLNNNSQLKDKQTTTNNHQFSRVLINKENELGDEENNINNLEISEESSCSSTSSLCNHNINKQQEETIMRQSVDLESYNSQIPLSTSSSYWNYDELNELRIKFISLLSSDLNNSKSTESNDSPILSPISSSASTTSSCSEPTRQPLKPMPKLSSMSFVPAALQPITADEHLKIESFYRSFGTSLYIANTAACLYTMTNLKVDSKFTSSSLLPNRASITISANNASTIINKSQQSDIDHNILKDFMNNRYQNHVSVYHRGVPLWLFNSGSNPRRPFKQLKFTLAEKGTGFILWQDRIDSCSDFKIYSLRKNDNKIINFISYCDKIDLKESKFIKVNDLFTSMLITFKASDRKTTVFVKFDLNNEAASFYDYYLNINKLKNLEIKQRTKSLPAGLGAQKFDQLKQNQMVTKRLHSKLNEQKRQNRQSFLSTGIKLKRISKNEISNPCDLKHIINICSSDRDSYYTLSKLLPASVYSSMSTSSSYASAPISTDLSGSSTSVSNTSSSSTSIASTNSVSVNKSDKRHSVNCNKEQKDQLSSLSSISLSITMPFKLIGSQDINECQKQTKIF